MKQALALAALLLPIVTWAAGWIDIEGESGHERFVIAEDFDAANHHIGLVYAGDRLKRKFACRFLPESSHPEVLSCQFDARKPGLQTTYTATFTSCGERVFRCRRGCSAQLPRKLVQPSWETPENCEPTP